MNLKPVSYQVRCQVLDGHIYYKKEGNEGARKRGSRKALQVEVGETLKNIDFRFAPFKKGTWRNYDTMVLRRLIEQMEGG